MAHAVCDDIACHGAEQVAALVVSHTDAEDLADRIRDQLADGGWLCGPALTGPGWGHDREYRAGDRVLLHARCGPPGAGLVNRRDPKLFARWQLVAFTTGRTVGAG